MKALVWLLISGVLWLGLVQTAPIFDVPPQVISLARSGYIGVFSIYLMVELRGAKYSPGHRPSHVYIYASPLISLLVLAAFSSDFYLTGSLLAIIVCFYLCAFALVNRRSETGQIRQAGWDVLAPPTLLILLLHPAVVAAAGLLCLAYIVRLLRRPAADKSQDGAHLDAFLVQLPSICIAPVVLIAFRDIFDGDGIIDRTHVESFGLVVNGVGAAIWTAIVLRNGVRLERLAFLLWMASFAGAAALAALAAMAALPVAIITSGAAILIAEGFRGAIWLGTTALLARLSRAKGFTANLAATLLPLAALWIGKDHLAPSLILLVYAGFVLPIPVAASVIKNRCDARIGSGAVNRQSDPESRPSA